jgi:hypothetical protein
VLALFAMLLSVLAGFLPTPSEAFGILAGDPASLCVPGGGAPNDHDPGPPRAHHSCPCCLTQPVNGAAIVPAAAGLAHPILRTADRPIASDPAPLAARPYTDSRPRAPPFAA